MLVLRHVVLSAAVLAGGAGKDGFAARGGSEAAGVLVGRAVVVARPALGSKIEIRRAVMGTEAPSRKEVDKAARAIVREHNRAVAQLASVAARNGHVGLTHDLVNIMLPSRLEADLFRARVAHAG